MTGVRQVTFTSLLTMSLLPCSGQDNVCDMPRIGGETVTEPSPEAMAMRHYQDVPVSYLRQYDFHARHLPLAVPLFTTPDRKSGDCPWLSPYLYCAANPIRNIDPWGEDIYTVDTYGRITHITTNDEFDEIQYLSIQGKVIDTQRFDKGVIIKNTYLDHPQYVDRRGNTKDAGTIDILVIRGDENAIKIYEKIAEHVGNSSQNEVGLSMTGYEGKRGKNYITSGHKPGQEPGLTFLYRTQLADGYNIRSMIHSHPSSSYASGGDIAFKDNVTEFQTRNRIRFPKFAIYNTLTKDYIYY